MCCYKFSPNINAIELKKREKEREKKEERKGKERRKKEIETMSSKHIKLYFSMSDSGKTIDLSNENDNGDANGDANDG